MLKKKIILVDDNPASLTTCKQSLKELYDIFPTKSAEKMFEVLENIIPELILLDVEMPIMNGYEALRILKNDERYKDITVIFLSVMDDAESEVEGLSLGAVDYIHKPIIGALLKKRVETHMQLIEQKRELLSLNKSIKNLAEPNKAIIKKDKIISEMVSKIRPPIYSVIQSVEAAIKSEDIGDIKRWLGSADIETRLILEILNNIGE